MAFLISNQRFISFATYDDLIQRDQRILEANENLTETEIDDYIQNASKRILTQIRNTDWWANASTAQNPSLGNDRRRIPSVNPLQILSREQEFKDLNIYFALTEYIYPATADFGNPESAEIAKIKFFKDQYNMLFDELIQAGDWYDFNDNDVIATEEKYPSNKRLVRIR